MSNKLITKKCPQCGCCIMEESKDEKSYKCLNPDCDYKEDKLERWFN